MALVNVQTKDVVDMEDIEELLNYYLELWLSEQEGVSKGEPEFDKYIAIVNFIEFVKENVEK